VPGTSSPYGVRLILNSALLLTAAGLVVRGCGALREIFFAAQFGVSRDTDLFFLAVTYATLLPAVLASALGTTLIAQLAELREGDKFQLGRPMELLASGVCAAALAAALGTYLLAPVLLSTLFGLNGADLEEAVRHARVLAPLGVTVVVSSSMDALLNSAKRFFIAGITAAATPLTMIAAIVLLGPRWGVEAAAWGMIAGGLAEVIVLSLFIGRMRHTLFAARPAAAAAVDIMQFWRSVGFLAMSAGIAASGPLIDQVFLAKLEVGAITTFNYASKVNSLLIGLFGTAFGVAIYPYLSDLAAKRDIAGLKHLSWRIVALIVPVTLLASALVFIFSHEIVSVLFARGNFTPEDTVLVAHIQSIFAFQLVFYVAGLVAMRVLNAVAASDYVFWISCLGIASTAFFDWLLYTRMGAGGIALSAVLTSAASLGCAVVFIRAALKRRYTSLAP
jgi:putative peptidoglycan lipid II flippase